MDERERYDRAVKRRAVIFVSLVASCAAPALLAQEPTRGDRVMPSDTAPPAPTTQGLAAPVIPTRSTPLAQLVRGLREDDPADRDAAREELMLLKRGELTQLADAARECMPMSPAQLAALREIVEHVYLTEFHRFEGIGSGFIGITAAAELTNAAVIARRTMGYDSFRVLRDGDTIVGLRPWNGTGFDAMRTVQTFIDVRDIVSQTTPGNWIVVRLIRNGEAMEVTLRLAWRDPRLERNQALDNPMRPAAEEFWNRTFLPRLNGPATRPAAAAD